MFVSDDSVYLRVRTPAPPPSTMARGNTTTGSSGDELFRALHGGMHKLWHQPLWKLWPWHATPHVALTMTGLPDLPIDMGIAVVDNDAQRRHNLVMAIRSVVLGQAQGAKVEVIDDPLARTVVPGVTLGWRLYNLAMNSEYPLRMIDDIEGSDLLAPLATATQPRGTDCVEVQVILRPVPRGPLNREWVGRAKALQIMLEAQSDYTMREDVISLEAKIDSQPFYAWVRVAVVANGDDAVQRVQDNLDQIEIVLHQYNEQTGHQTQSLKCIDRGVATVGTEITEPVARVLIRAPGIIPPARLLLPFDVLGPARIFSARELAGLWHVPTYSMSQSVRFLPCKYLPAPPHAFCNGQPDRIAMGYAHRADGTLAKVGPTLRDIRMPMHVTAGMGGGKSRLLSNISVQCFGYGLLLLDGKGDDSGNLVNTVRQHISLADEERVVLIDMLDSEWPVGMNPLAGIDREKSGGIDQALAQLFAIFARLDPATWDKAPGMQQYLKQGSLLVLEVEAHPTLAHVKQALIDDNYRASLLGRCKNRDVKTFWEEIYPKTGEAQKTSRDALLRRFDTILSTEVTRYFMSQELPTVDLLDAIESKKIVLVPMPWVTYGALAATIGMMVFQSVVRSATRRPGNDQTRATIPMIIDEFQIFVGQGAGDDVSAALTQLRAFGIAGIYAHQVLKQLGELLDEMLGNTGSRVVIKTNEPDASTYAKYYAASGLIASDVSGQDPMEHQYAAYTCNGKPTGLFSQMVMPWPEVTRLAVPDYDGSDWQTLLPPDARDPEQDHDILSIVYGKDRKGANYTSYMARMPEEDWQHIRARWQAISAYQRQYIIDHPGCIAYDPTIIGKDNEEIQWKRDVQQRSDRQRWLSRLKYATPLALAKIEYERIRTGMGAGDQPNNGPHAPTNEHVTGPDGSVIDLPKTTIGMPEPESALLGGVDGSHTVDDEQSIRRVQSVVKPAHVVLYERAQAARKAQEGRDFNLPESERVPSKGI